MKKGDKKGVSAVITTLLIILLSLVAIAVVWVVIQNLVSEGSSDVSLDRFAFNIAIRSAYIDGQDVKISVHRNAGGGDLQGIYFIFHNGTDSISVQENFALEALNDKLFSFSFAAYPGLSTSNLVSVAPVYASGGKDTIGDITDTAEIRTSPPPGTGGDNGDDGDGGDDGGVCNDGTVDSGEECDGSNLNGQSCIGLGFDGGTLSCDANCQFETSQCTEPPPASCNGTWTQEDINDGNQCDGGSNCVSCTCSSGYVSDGSGGCVPEPSLNNGTIDSVWPPEAVRYFDSNDLPKSGLTMQSYTGTAHYVNFSGAETRCLRINYAEYLSDPAYDKSYIRVELTASILPGDSYTIWASSTCGA